MKVRNGGKFMGLIWNEKVEESKILEAYGLIAYGKINCYDWSFGYRKNEDALITLRITDTENNEIFSVYLGNNCILQSRIDDTLDNFLYWIVQEHPDNYSIEKQVYDSLTQSNCFFNDMIMRKKMLKRKEEEEKRKKEEEEKKKNIMIDTIKSYCAEKGFFLFLIWGDEACIIKPISESGKKNIQDRVNGTYKDKEIVIDFVEKYPKNKDAELINKGSLEEMYKYVCGDILYEKK